MKRNGESGSPSLRPLEGMRILEGDPFTNIQKLEEVTRAIAHLTQL